MKVEPGIEFQIGYGDGKKVTVTALSLRQKIQVVELLKKLDSSPGHESYKTIADALSICCKDSESLIESIDERDAMEIIVATIEKQRLSEDEVKK